MGFIRKGGIFLLISALFVGLIAMNFFLTVGLSLKQENIKQEAPAVISGTLLKNSEVSSELDSSFQLMQLYCQNNSEYVFRSPNLNETLSTPCDVVSQGKDAVIEYNLQKFIDKIYYQEYSCSFWDCINDKNQNQFFILSNQSRVYWMNKFYFTLFIIILISAGLFFLFENKFNFLLTLGIFTIISSLPFMKLDSIFSLFGNPFFELLSILVSKSKTVFLIMFILGILIFIVGLGFKLSYFTISKLEDSKKQKS